MKSKVLQALLHVASVAILLVLLLWAFTAVAQQGVSGQVIRSNFHGSLNLTGPLAVNGNPGTSGQVLTSAGPGLAPTWATPSAGGITGVGTNGAVTFWTGTSTVSADSTNFFWDNTSKRLGLGTASPGQKLHIQDNTSNSQFRVNTTAGFGGEIVMWADEPLLGNRPRIEFGHGSLTFGFNRRIQGLAGTNDIVFYAPNSINNGAIERLRIVGGDTGGLNVSSNMSVSGAASIGSSLQFGNALLPGGTAGTSGQVLTSAGAGAVPTWTTPSSGVTGSSTSGAVTFWNGTSSVAGDATRLFWDNTNKRLDVKTAALNDVMTIQNLNNSFTSSIRFLNDAGANRLTLGFGNSTSGSLAGNKVFYQSLGGVNQIWAIDTTTLMTLSPTLLNVGLPLQFSGALLPAGLPGAAGQILTSSGPGVAPVWAPTASGGVTSLGPVGTTPNVNAASIVGSAINLEPASATFPGVVTAGTQTFGGTKSFNGTVFIDTDVFVADSGNNRVGINNASPAVSLDVVSSALNDVATFRNLNNGFTSSIRFLSDGGVNRLTMGFGNSSSGSLAGNKVFYQSLGANQIWAIDTTTHMVLSPTLFTVGLPIQFTGALLPAGNAGTSGQLLTSAGPGVSPTWTTPPAADVTTAPLNLFVDTAGSDANTCLTGNACLTIANALTKIPKKIRHPVTVNVGAGNFAGAVVDGFEISSIGTAPYLLIRGTMANSVISGSPVTGTLSTGSAGNAATTNWGGGSVATITWVTNELRGRWITITGGTGVGQMRLISANTTNTFTITGAWAVTPNSSSTFAIQEPSTIINAPATIPNSYDTATTTDVGFAVTNTTTEIPQTGADTVSSRVILERMRVIPGVTNVIHTMATTAVAARTLSFTTPGTAFTSGSAPFALNVHDCYSTNTSFIGTSAPGAVLNIQNNVVSGGSQVWQTTTPATLISTTNLYLGQTVDAFRIAAQGAEAMRFVGDKIDCNSAGGGGIRPASTTSSAAPISFTSSSVSNCTVGIGGRGLTSINLVGVSGTGNTVALQSLQGTNMKVDAASTITGTSELDVDGTTYTLATMRAASPKAISDVTYGSIVYE